MLDTERQGKVAQEIVEHWSLKMLMEAEKSLKLLQGLLIFIAWSVHQPLLLEPVSQAV